MKTCAKLSVEWLLPGLATRAVLLVCGVLLGSDVLANTTQILQIQRICQTNSRVAPNTNCTNCHTSSSGNELNANGSLFKEAYADNQSDSLLTTFCASSKDVVRQRPVVAVASSQTATVGIPMSIVFTAVDPQNEPLSITVLGKPAGVRMQKTPIGGGYQVTLNWTPKKGQARARPYRIKVLAKQLSGSPRLKSVVQTIQITVVK